MFNYLQKALFIGLLIAATQVSAVNANNEETLRIVTGRSSYSLVIDKLVEGFKKQYPSVTVEVIKKGSFPAMAIARKRQVDILISYHREGERRLLKEGTVSSRVEFMFSSYAIFGPPDDKLDLIKETDIQTVLKKISDSNSIFIVPSKKGGMYYKMAELWRGVGIKPNDDWYDIIDTTTLSVMRIAAEQEAYALGDIYNYYLNKDEFGASLVPLYQGGYELHKAFSVLTINHKENNNKKYADEFVDFIISDMGQQIISKANKDIFNAPVFFPAVNFNPSAIAKQENSRLQKATRNLNIVTGLFIATVSMLLVAIYMFFRTRYFRREKVRAEIDKGVAELANKTKSEFLSRMSHELRTPLNAILGFSQILEMKEEDGQKKKNLLDIVKAGQHLHHLINDILELSNIESTQVGIKLCEVAVNDIINDCIMLSQKEISNNQVTVKLQDIGNHKVVADPLRLKEVILNLISNAAKYNRKNGIITIETLKVGNERLKITIGDTGLGIQDDKKALLFEPFERLGMEKSGIEGTGIGLVICENLMGLMAGSIGCESRSGIGSKFWIELPRA